MFSNTSRQFLWVVSGILFSILWASAAAATKIGLTSAQPLVIAVARFGIAATILLIVSHIIQGHRLPSGKEWKQLTIYGFFNITLYLGCYVVAMQQVTAGIGALAIAFWLLNDPISWYTSGGVLLVILGLALSQKSARKNETG